MRVLKTTHEGIHRKISACTELADNLSIGNYIGVDEPNYHAGNFGYFTVAFNKKRFSATNLHLQWTRFL